MRRLCQLLIRRRLAVVAGLAACTAAPDHVTGLRSVGTLSADLDGNPVVQSVTGHWEVIGSSGNLNKISVNAEKRLDGTVTGEIQYEQFTDDGLSTLAHGTVLCLTVDGNRARLAAAGEATTDAGAAPAFGILTAFDNGESNPSPDLASNLIAVSTEARARVHCGDVPLIPDTRALPVQRGNVQVRS